MPNLKEILSYIGDWISVRNQRPKLLWSGGYYMSASHTVNFAEKASEQPSGIVLVFSAYENGAVANWGFHSFFIPKSAITARSGCGYTFVLSTSAFSAPATKYLYISDDHISGHDANTTTGTATSGIKYANNKFVLREVWGV